MSYLRLAFVTTGFVLFTAAMATQKVPPFDVSELKPGGETTHFKTMDANAFSHSSANLSFEQQVDFKVGNGLFRRVWVSSPASTSSADGLGPLYNARSCQRCHLKDGRGHPPASEDDTAVSLILNLSVPPLNEEEQALLADGTMDVLAEPVYGRQLQDFAIQGFAAEGQVKVDYQLLPVTMGDGSVVHLKQPTWRVEDLAYGPMRADTQMSARVAPQMIGLGLLELIPEADIVALSDPNDVDEDGVSGKVRRVWSEEAQATVIGRFGWKLGSASVSEQVQKAFLNDIGIAVPLFPVVSGDCSPAQLDCLNAPGGDDHNGLEANQQVIDVTSFYSRHLAVPARRNAENPDVIKGRELFYQNGCAKCHQPSFTTGYHPDSPELSNQKIWPYTDLLLHDMGPGLADNRPEGSAGGAEWRTPPLWGIGLTVTVNQHSRFLHDGRAENLQEAILWHGGEAEEQRESFKAMTETQRQQLILFLESL